MKPIRDRLDALTPAQLKLFVTLMVAIVLALAVTGGLTELLKWLVMLFIDMVVRISSLIFRW